MRQLCMKNGFTLLKANWALVIRSELLLSTLYLLFIPLIRGVANLDALHSAECLEQAVAVVGVFLLVPLSGPEQNRETQEIVFSKRKPYGAVLLLRLVMALAALLGFVGLFAFVMTALNCTFPFAAYVLGTFASALALGGCGFLAAALSDSVIAGYFISAGYYLLDLLGGISADSRLSLFSMSAGSFEAKYWLTAVGIVCIFVVLLYQRLHRR